jgi:hypothetical protein
MRANTNDDQDDIEPLPDRVDVLRTMLRGTGRGGVPVRSAFVQRKEPDANGSRRGLLAEFTTDGRALDAYLLIHALASSKAPYSASYPASVWARAAGLDRDATEKSARQRWAKAVAKLSRLNLIETSREGRQSVYTLLHESGNTEEYTRPTSLAHGGWVTIPHAYWLEGLDQSLSLPEKLMLLISLDQKQRFELPTNRVEEWYGVPDRTASRGFTGLRTRGILAVSKRTTIDLQNGKSMMRRVNVYSTVEPWTLVARKKTMTVPRSERKRLVGSAPQ